MLPRELEKITEEDMKSLVNGGVVESKTIEYKSALPGDTDLDKKEFLADVSSFANAVGGLMIFGIAADNKSGVPVSMVGMDIQNPDSEISRLENLIRSGLEPRLPKIHTRSLMLSNGSSVILIKVDRSWLAPHRVIFKSHGHFYSRSSNGKYPMDVSELRTAFGLTGAVSERIRRFREMRISKVIANETPVPLIPNPKIILHLVPLFTVSLGRVIQFTNLRSWEEHLPPPRSSSWEKRYNLDGLLTYDAIPKQEASSYVQVFRNGIIEMVESETISRDEGIPSTLVESILLGLSGKYLQFMKMLELELPIFLFLCLVGVKGLSLTVKPHQMIYLPSHDIDRDIVDLPEIQIDSFESEAQHFLRPVFDSIWNACGYSRCQNYNSEGNWVGQ